MSEENIFTKCGAAEPHNGIHRNAAQVTQSTALRAVQCERDQSRPSLCQAQPELARGLVAEIGRADLGNRQASRRKDDRFAFEVCKVSRNHKASILGYAGHLTIRPDLNADSGTFFKEHVDDLL